MQLHNIVYYPIKSLPGVSVSEHPVGPLGLQWDRRWMLVETDGRFVSQRQDPMLASLKLSAHEEGWAVQHPKHGVVSVPHELRVGQRVSVQVWDDDFEAHHDGSIADDFFSSFLGRSVKLVYHHRVTSRLVDPSYTAEDAHVGFADGFPYLILGTASIEFCQSLCPNEAIDWRRFRPNMVFSSEEAFAEDQWSALQIGSAIFDLVKPCARCVMITLDPDTGLGGSDLLKALSPHRLQAKGIMVGQNALLREGAVLRVGDRVVPLG